MSFVVFVVCSRFGCSDWCCFLDDFCTCFFCDLLSLPASLVSFRVCVGYELAGVVVVFGVVGVVVVVVVVVVVLVVVVVVVVVFDVVVVGGGNCCCCGGGGGSSSCCFCCCCCPSVAVVPLPIYHTQYLYTFILFTIIHLYLAYRTLRVPLSVTVRRVQ